MLEAEIRVMHSEDRGRGYKPRNIDSLVLFSFLKNQGFRGKNVYM